MQKRFPNGTFATEDPTACSPKDQRKRVCSLQSDDTVSFHPGSTAGSRLTTWRTSSLLWEGKRLLSSHWITFSMLATIWQVNCFNCTVQTPIGYQPGTTRMHPLLPMPLVKLSSQTLTSLPQVYLGTTTKQRWHLLGFYPALPSNVMSCTHCEHKHGRDR